MKAITRKEQFLSAIAGETEAPEPRTREEVYMKRIAENGSGGGSTGGGVFGVVITVNGETNEATADKTKAEILEAIDNHQTIQFTYCMQFGEESFTKCQWYGANIDLSNNQIYTVGFSNISDGSTYMVFAKFSDTGVEVIANQSVYFSTVTVTAAQGLELKGTDNKRYKIVVNGGTITAEVIS